MAMSGGIFSPRSAVSVESLAYRYTCLHTLQSSSTHATPESPSALPPAVKPDNRGLSGQEFHDVVIDLSFELRPQSPLVDWQRACRRCKVSGMIERSA